MAARSRKRAKRDAAVKAAGPLRSLAGRKQRLGPDGKTTRRPWVAPDDMPQWMADLVREGRMCGGRLQSGRGYCTARPTPHQDTLGRPLPHRCDHHGGAVPQQCLPPGRMNTTKHGLYSGAVMEGEEERWEELLRTGSTGLDREIAITKLRLERAVKAERDQADAVRAGGELEAMELWRREHVEESDDKLDLVVGGDGGLRADERPPKYKVVHERRLVDFGRRIHAIVLELAKLFGQKALLQGEDMGADERAGLAREALRAARASVAGERKAADDDE